MSLVLDQDADDILVAVTGCPKERVPAVFLDLWVGTDFDCLTDTLIVIVFDCRHEKSVPLGLGHLLIFILFRKVFIITASASSFNHLLLFSKLSTLSLKGR